MVLIQELILDFQMAKNILLLKLTAAIKQKRLKLKCRESNFFDIGSQFEH